MGTLDVDGGTAEAGNNGSNITLRAQKGALNFSGGDIIITPGSGQGLGTAGNVGIGTTNPEAKLHVNGSDDGGIRIDGTGNGHAVIGYNQTGGYLRLVAYDVGWKNVVVPIGNVGIGIGCPKR